MPLETQPAMITAEYIAKLVAQSLAEDIAGGDITAELIDADVQASGRIVTREDGILCGTAFALEAFQQIDPSCHVEWAAQDGDAIAADSLVCTLSGPARALLTGERTALNFLQLLSGTASTAAQYAARVAHTGVKLLDTRKTVPGLRLAQKYAVTCGGCYSLTYFRIASTSMTRESSGNRRSPDKEVCCPAPWTSSHRACCSSIWDSGTRRAFPAFWKHSAISSMR